MLQSSIDSIVNALSWAAQLIATSVVTEEIKDNYYRLKNFLGEKFRLETQVSLLEGSPTDKEDQNSLAKGLKYNIDNYKGSEEINSLLCELSEITQALATSLKGIRASDYNENSTIIKGDKNVVQKGYGNVNSHNKY
jgi:hypothetical protein